jgi:TRAP-type C4-dicarboxylate transport system permease small subunit
MLAALVRHIERLAVWLAGAGAAIIVVQMLWISYGVFMRYIVGRPDGTVTEATALLLFPAAFLGLAFALKEDAYPKVTFLPDALGPRGRRRLEILNLLLMITVGGFFSIAAVDATLGSFASGASSEILLWPRYLFWAPGALALVIFTAYVVLRLAVVLTTPRPEPELQPVQRG